MVINHLLNGMILQVVTDHVFFLGSMDSEWTGAIEGPTSSWVVGGGGRGLQKPQNNEQLWTPKPWKMKGFKFQALKYGNRIRILWNYRKRGFRSLQWLDRIWSNP